MTGDGGVKFGFICIEALLSTNGAVTTAVHVGNESSMDGVGFQRLASSRQCTSGFQQTALGSVALNGLAKEMAAQCS